MPDTPALPPSLFALAQAGAGRADHGERRAVDQDDIHGLGHGAIATVATVLFLFTHLHPLLVLGAAAALRATGFLT